MTEKTHMLVSRNDVGELLDMARLIKIPHSAPTPAMIEAFNRLAAALNEHDRMQAQRLHRPATWIPGHCYPEGGD